MVVVRIKLNIGDPTPGQLSHSHLVPHCPALVKLNALFFKISDSFGNYSLSAECYAYWRRCLQTGQNLLKSGCSTFSKKCSLIFIKNENQINCFITFWKIPMHFFENVEQTILEFSVLFAYISFNLLKVQNSSKVFQNTPQYSGIRNAILYYHFNIKLDFWKWKRNCKSMKYWRITN